MPYPGESRGGAGRLGRRGRNVRAFKSRARPKGNLKKTTKKGAYKPARKKQFQKRRAPFVETHRHSSGYGFPGQPSESRLVLSNVLSSVQLAAIPVNASPDGGSNAPASGTTIVKVDGVNDTAFNCIVPDISYLKTTDVDEYRCTPDAGLVRGDSCYYKMLTTKLEFSFPQAQYSLSRPTRLYVYQVWVKTPLNLTAHTTPTRSAVTSAQIEDHVRNACQEWFNSRQDHFLFRELKDGVNIKVLRKMKVNVNRNNQIQYYPISNQGLANPTAGPANTWPAGTDVPAGLQPGPGNSGLEKWFRSFTWHYNRKQHFECMDTPGGPDGKHDLYTNISWFPALIVYNPDFTHQGRQAEVNVGTNYLPSLIKVAHNSCLWYTDS